MKKFKTPVFLVIFLILAYSVAFAALEDWKLVTRLAGVVQSQFGGAGKWFEIAVSKRLTNGDRARTLDNSRAKIQLADQSVITLGEKTMVEMSKFQLSDRSRTVQVKVITGRIRAKVGEFVGQKSEFEVQTPNAVMAAKGTEFWVEYSGGTIESTGAQNSLSGMPFLAESNSSGGVTSLAVFSNTVALTAGGKTIDVHAGNTAMVGPDGVIILNPVGLNISLSGKSQRTPDADLLEYKPAERERPRDPYMQINTVPPGSDPGLHQKPGGINPDAGGNTGNINIIIHPH